MNITRQLIDAICQINVTVSADRVPVDEPLIKAGILDSFGFVQLIVRIENDFNLEVADEDIIDDNFGTLGKMAAFIGRKTGRG
jgi:acyl carrier protein